MKTDLRQTDLSALDDLLDYYHVTLVFDVETRGNTIYFLLNQTSCELIDVEQFFYYCDVSEFMQTLIDLELYCDIRYRTLTDREEDDLLCVHIAYVAEFPREYKNDIGEDVISDRLHKYQLFETRETL